MKIKEFITLFLIIFTGLILFPGRPVSGETSITTNPGSRIIKAIEIRGNKNIETNTILSKISIKVGDTFSPGIIRDNIQSLYSTDYFDNIQVKTENMDGGIKVIFIVDERDILKEVSFVGNYYISTEKLKEKLSLIEGTPFSGKQVQENVERLRSLYEDEGYYQALIIPFIERHEDNTASVTFFIEEGKKVKIKEIRIRGAKKISEREILKNIKTRTYNRFLSWLTGSGIYKEIEAENDVDRIREYYLDRGYIKVQVSGPRVEIIKGGEWMRIIFTVVEGDQYRIRKISFSGNDIFTPEELYKKLELKKGMIFSRSLLGKDMRLLIDLYGEKGYAFAKVTPKIEPDDLTKEVDITYVIDKGEKIKIRRINITGNTKTRDKVIRRELRLAEQEYLNTQALRRSFQRLNNLNFFEKIEITPQMVTRSMVDLNIKVKEKPTGAFSMGGGYSSVYGFVGMIDLTEGNLFGRGQLLKIKAEMGQLRTNYDITFREPWLMDKPTSMTLRMFNTITSFDTYDIHSRGGSIGFGHYYGEYWSAGISYGFQDISLAGTPPSTLIQEPSKTGSITTSVTRDTRDNYLDPRSGSKNYGSIKYADRFLGGNNIFAKYILDTAWYFPLPYNTAFMFHARYGIGKGLRGRNLPVNEKFYVGGIYTVRGFDYGRASTPSTIAGDPATGELLGADKELIFNVEYIVPLVKEAHLNGVVFFDAGSGFGKNDSITLSDLRTSVGGGLRWLSPIGPLRLEWGYNLHPRPGERQGLWEFSIGSLF